MSINKKLALFIVLISVTTTSGWASCTRVDTQPTVMINMDLGKIVVSPDLPVGATITSRTWQMPASAKANYRCTAGTYNFLAKIVSNGIDIGNKIYSTNVKGIGLRFRRGSSVVNIIYPDTYSSTIHSTSNFGLVGSSFTLEVIKTESVTGSGTIASGKYTSYDLEGGNNPILETEIIGDAITVVSPSCTISSGKNMNVYVGTIKRSDLSGIGSTAGNKNFNIKLQCSSGVTTSGVVNIHTSFSGAMATDTSSTNGVLINEKQGSSMAKGVGIQILMENEQPINFDKDYIIKNLGLNETQFITIPLQARFYQYATSISTGEVESHMIFNITYD